MPQNKKKTNKNMYLGDRIELGGTQCQWNLVSVSCCRTQATNIWAVLPSPVSWNRAGDVFPHPQVKEAQELHLEEEEIQYDVNSMLRERLKTASTELECHCGKYIVFPVTYVQDIQETDCQISVQIRLFKSQKIIPSYSFIWDE